MFFPLVVLVAVLPGLVGLNSWDLTPPGPLWGLRALAVLDGLYFDQVPAAAEIKPMGESAAFQAVAFQPPLYAWLAAFGMWLSGDFDPLASVLPSYVAGVIVVILVYLHGRLWRGGGLGFAAALLIGFNPRLLLKMQEATPMTLALAGAVAALLCYGWHLRSSGESMLGRAWSKPVVWALAGGLCLGLSLLSLGGLGLLVLPVILLHQIYLRAATSQASPSEFRGGPWWSAMRGGTGLAQGLLALAITLIVAVPWHVLMAQVHGWGALAGLELRAWGAGPGTDEPGLLAQLFELAPAMLPLGLYGVARAFRLALIDENNSPEAVGGSFWLIWLAVAALAPAFWPSGPLVAMRLFLLVPLSLLAASTVADLVNRRVPVRTLIVLAPATAMCVAWWASEDLKGAIDDLWHGRADAATALGLHLVLDLVLVSIWFTRRLDRWARHRDDRQRQVLAVFLVAMLAITVGAGIREVVFRHSETHDLLTLRTMILRRNRERPFELLAVVGLDVPPARSGSGSTPQARPDEAYTGGWLRFILRTALPHLPQRDLRSIDELLVLPEGQRLVILAGSGGRLSHAVKSRLGLEAIHPGRTGVLDAYATAQNRPTRR
jgi:4-amino-4-deoxy-L-arabinose transferase-like glycosyltransferase